MTARLSFSAPRLRGDKLRGNDGRVVTKIIEGSNRINRSINAFRTDKSAHARNPFLMRKVASGQSGRDFM
jgi:hypothetical protein